MPTFSVVIPTYNRAHLLPRCLESVLRQSFQDFEVIVADDGSTDDSPQVVEQFAGASVRLQYLSQENLGAGDARNLGASVAHGNFLTFLDSDDEVNGDWLARFNDELQSSDPDIICCSIGYVDKFGNTCRERQPAHLGSNVGVLRGLYRSGTFAIQRELFQSLGGYAAGLSANQHSELRCRLELSSRKHPICVACIPDVLVRAHEHDGSKLRRDDQRVYESARYVLEHHGALLRENPFTYSSWASACAGAAARLGRYADAQQWLRRAISVRPHEVRNYARLALAYSPIVRWLVWSKWKAT